MVIIRIEPKGMSFEDHNVASVAEAAQASRQGWYRKKYGTDLQNANFLPCFDHINLAKSIYGFLDCNLTQIEIQMTPDYYCALSKCNVL